MILTTKHTKYAKKFAFVVDLVFTVHQHALKKKPSPWGEGCWVGKRGGSPLNGPPGIGFPSAGLQMSLYSSGTMARHLVDLDQLAPLGLGLVAAATAVRVPQHIKEKQGQDIEGYE